MAIRGRKPKVGGKQTGRKGAAPAISTGAFDLTPPTWLNKHAQEAWARLVPILVEAKLIEAADCDTVAEYCDWYSLRRKAREEMGDSPLSKDDGKSYHQLLNAISLASKQMRQLAGELGLTPVARMRLRGSGGGGGESDDGIGEYLD